MIVCMKNNENTISKIISVYPKNDCSSKEKILQRFPLMVRTITDINFILNLMQKKIDAKFILKLVQKCHQQCHTKN